MSFYEATEARGVLAQVTHPEELNKLLSTEKITLYAGFDPTADSLHVGHLIPLLTLARAQRMGHRPIALVGGGTALIGDPTGKTDMRKMMTAETIDQNVAQFRVQMARFLDFSEDRALLVNNNDWLAQLNYLEVLRDLGPSFSVNRMLSAECFKSRFEGKGLSFLEFNYMILQAYDFLVLNQRYDCKLQIGGDDQWSNMLSGADLIRRKRQQPAFALTNVLLTTSEGKKMGKTEKGALWLDANKTTPFEFYQYFRNVPDDRVGLCLAFFTHKEADEIKRLSGLQGAEINVAKETLAFEVTKLVHGEEAATQSRSAAQAAFYGGGSRNDMPTTLVARSQVSDGLSIIDALINTQLAKSKGEARRLIAGGGVRFNGDKVLDHSFILEAAAFEGDGVELRKGKKVYHLIKLSEAGN